MATMRVLNSALQARTDKVQAKRRMAAFLPVLTSVQNESDDSNSSMPSLT
jgi:hypothetical protein